MGKVSDNSSFFYYHAPHLYLRYCEIFNRGRINIFRKKIHAIRSWRWDKGKKLKQCLGFLSMIVSLAPPDVMKACGAKWAKTQVYILHWAGLLLCTIHSNSAICSHPEIIQFKCLSLFFFYAMLKIHLARHRNRNLISQVDEIVILIRAKVFLRAMVGHRKNDFELLKNDYMPVWRN